MTQRPPFPECIDNSMRSTFRRCPRRFELEYLQHWKPARTNQHLQGGGAFAAGLETARRAFFVDGLSEEAAIIRGWGAVVDYYTNHEEQDGDTKTCERMTSALLYYFNTWPLSQDFLVPAVVGGKPIIEFSFSFPLDVAHPVTGNPLLYYGRFDMCGQHRDSGDLYVVDEKTASQLGQSWVEGWGLDSQFTGYCYAARDFNMPVVGAIIRGVSILKTGHGHAQSIQQRPQWQLDRWLEQLHRDIKQMIRMWEEGYFDYDLSGGCKMYGGCHFRGVCASPNPERWLEAEFVQREYSPWKQEEAK